MTLGVYDSIVATLGGRYRCGVILRFALNPEHPDEPWWTMFEISYRTFWGKRKEWIKGHSIDGLLCGGLSSQTFHPTPTERSASSQPKTH